MTNIFITKSGVLYPLTGEVAGKWEISNLSENALALFNEDGSLIGDSISNFNISKANITGDNIVIGYIDKDGSSRFSVPIPVKGFKFGKVSYSAPVAPIKVLGGEKTGQASTYSLNLPASISVGDLVGVAIVDKTKDFFDTRRVKEYSFTTVSSDSLSGVDANNIITKLVTLINKDSKSVVVAEAMNDGTNNTGIKFTGKTGIDFEISKVDGVLKEADVVEYKIVNGVYTPASTVTVVGFNVGHGTSAHVAKAERDTLPYLGKQTGQVLENELWKSAPNVVDGETYISYVVPFAAPRDSRLSLDGNFEQLIGIYVPVETETVGSTLTSGTLQVGKTYKINNFVSGDDFSNVGANNVTGDIFVATGTTPTAWTNSSSLIQLRVARIEYALDKVFGLLTE